MQIESKRWLVLSSDPKGEGIHKTNTKKEKGRITDFSKCIIWIIEQKLITYLQISETK